jgi:PKD repeat protein
LTYNWDFSSVDSSTYVSKVDRTGSTVTVTAPPPIIARVTLNVTSGTLHASAARLLPLAVGGAPNTIPVKATAGVTGSWLGGVPSYSGSYIFCPAQNPTDFSVCSKPAVTIPIGTQSQNKTVLLTYNFAGLYTSTLSITDSAPSQVGPSTAMGSFLINVTGSPPVFTVSLASNASRVDIGQTVMYTASVAYSPSYPVALSSSGFLYVFSFGDGTSQSISLSRSASVTHTYSSAGSFSVGVTAQETVHSSISKSNIRENGYSTMTVNQPVAGNFAISSASSQTGQAITFTATSSGGTGTYSYSWDFGDGSTSNATNPTHSYSNAGTYKVKLTITDSYGASTTSNQTVTITAAPAPAFPLTYVAGGVVAALALVAALFLIRRRRKTPTIAP